jgi:hypothetical protein
MIRIEDIKRELAHVVGWEQGLVPKDLIDDSLTQSESGLYFQEAHPMVTMENLRAVMPEMDVELYPEWNSATFYKKGSIVRLNGKLFSAKENNLGNTPRTKDFNGDYDDDFSTEDDPIGDPGYWEPFDPMSVWLKSLQDGVTAKTVQTFLQVKSLLKESRPLLERMTFFDGAGRIQNTLPSGQRLVGMEIIPAYSMGVTAKIERIGLQMTGATGTVRVYLFHSSQSDPIQVEDLEFTKTNGGFQWFTMKDWYMPFISDANNSGGAWYLVYDLAALPDGMECVNVAKDWSREPCGTCNIGSLAAWRALTKYLSISPFRVRSSETFAEFPELWDIAENVYTNTVNYGLNVEVTVQCDLTDFIIEQRQMFATVLQREMAAKVLRMLAMNPSVRVNRNQSNASHLDLLYEVDGNPQGRKTGIGYELEKAYEALDLDTRGIDRLCMTCRPVGVRYRNV